LGSRNEEIRETQNTLPHSITKGKLPVPEFHSHV
jgi:hypothetical protein